MRRREQLYDADLNEVSGAVFGGEGDDYPGGLAIDARGIYYLVGEADGNAFDAAGDILLSGVTDSADFPLTVDAAQPHIAGLTDGFLAKVSALGDLLPDFGVAVVPSTLTVAKGASGTLAVDIARSGAFTGRVTVTAPNTKAIKVELTPASSSTSGKSVTIKYKVKKKAQPGTYDLVFTGRDENGKERTATLSLTIQ